MSKKGIPREIRTLQSVPTMQEYKSELNRLSTNLRALVTLRLLAETGMSRIEVCTILRSNLNVERRELFLHRSKAIKKIKNGKTVYVERNRHVPINSNLMPLLMAYLGTHDSPFIIAQHSHFKKIHALKPESLNKLFLTWEIPWSPHKYRHFFKSQMKFSMIKNKSVDMEVIKEIMGHSMSVAEKYGENPLEYKLELVDRTFG